MKTDEDKEINTSNKHAEKIMRALWDRVSDVNNIKDEDIKPILRELVSNCYWISKCLVWQEEEIKSNYKTCDLRQTSMIEWFDFDRKLTFTNYIKEKLFGIKIKD